MKNRKPIFFTSDWHIGHANCIIFDKRPFKDLDEMHKALIRRHNAMVPENGITYFLGDMGVSSTELCKSIIDQLNGTKVLILGNHDKNANAMYNAGFDVVLNNATIKIQGELVTMSHCPLRGLYREDVTGMKGAVEGENWHGEHRHNDFSIANHGGYHLAGHCHAPNSGKSKKIEGKQYDVGVVANNYAPVSFSTIERWIAKDKKDRK